MRCWSNFDISFFVRKPSLFLSKVFETLHWGLDDLWFFRSKSNHCLGLSLTDWLTHWCYRDLIDETLADDDNPMLADNANCVVITDAYDAPYAADNLCLFRHFALTCKWKMPFNESDKSRRFSKSTQKLSSPLCHWHCFVLSYMNVKDLYLDQAPWTPFQQDLSTQKRLVRHPGFCLRRGFQCTGCYDTQYYLYKHNIRG